MLLHSEGVRRDKPLLDRRPIPNIFSPTPPEVRRYLLRFEKGGSSKIIEYQDLTCRVSCIVGEPRGVPKSQKKMCALLDAAYSNRPRDEVAEREERTNESSQRCRDSKPKGGRRSGPSLHVGSVAAARSGHSRMNGGARPASYSVGPEAKTGVRVAAGALASWR